MVMLIAAETLPAETLPAETLPAGKCDALQMQIHSALLVVRPTVALLLLLLLLLLQPAGATPEASPPAMVERPSGALGAVAQATATSRAHTPRTAALAATCTGAYSSCSTAASAFRLDCMHILAAALNPRKRLQ
jgi:hypothetical protein